MTRQFKTLKSCFCAGTSFLILATAASAALAQENTESVIVTGTRVSGMTAADSAAPVTVLGADTLTHVGQANLISALAQQVPSFNAEAFGGDLAEYTLSARLRGVSPNHTLVLVNGKRRHITGDLHVLSSAYQGSDTADLSLIPVASIDHVEVLQDGAAAQYGTDAIAGVVNIILKSDSAAGVASGTIGQYYKGDGESYDLSLNKGFELGSAGYINLTYEKRYHGFSQRGFGDDRIVSANGTPVAGLSFDATKVDGYPNVNKIIGDAEFTLSNYSYNAGYDLGDLQFYSFGSYSTRSAKGYENVRLATSVAVAKSPYYPNGFSPFEGIDETDYSMAVGVKGTLAGWRWDLSTVYGQDYDAIYTLHSANNSMYRDTLAAFGKGFTQTNFYDGAFVAGQLTNNLDIVRDFDVGMASPLTIAFGGEMREDTYKIKPGDPASTYKEGGQSYPGYLPTDAGSHSRKNYAGYFDVALSPIEALQVDVAGRFEHYTDFGDAEIGKVTMRYDFSPKLAVRGTISSGFRAPTLAEEYYSATNVSPTSAFVQLPPNAPATRLLGVGPLAPESSINYSAGIVAHPFDALSVTLDAYSISIGNRIIGTGSLYGVGGAINSPAVVAAIAANGNVLDPTVTFQGASMFVNGAATKTQGVDLTANYYTDYDAWGTVDWTLAANFNETTLSWVRATPAPLVPQPLFSPSALSNLTTASPKEKVTFGALWNIEDWTINLQESIYGPTKAQTSPNGGTYYLEKVSTAGITDLDVTYHLTDYVSATLGANNLFDKNPETVPLTPAGKLANGSHVWNAPLTISPYGINGGYYYGRVTFKF
ncbi:MAG: TonB-dependent receptor [Alphaproteobacteria bacterium]|nr:TonB-dependent receptor [Alphaproteobacteria bacterium]